MSPGPIPIGAGFGYVGVFVSHPNGKVIRYLFNLGPIEMINNVPNGPTAGVEAAIRAAAELVIAKMRETGLFTDG